jgi:membrane protease YdiL (CAAX protease family)
MSMYPAEPSPLPTPAIAGRTPDLGSRKAAMRAWIAAIVLMAVVVILNQFGGSEPAAPKAANPTAASVEAPDPGDPFVVAAKFMVKACHAIGADPNSTKEVMNALAPSAHTKENQVRLAIVAADLQGAQAGIDRLDAISDPPDALKEDIGKLKAFYESIKEAPSLRTVDIDEREKIVEHHGWFGKLAYTTGLPDTDPQRAALLSGLGWLIGAGLLGFVAFLTAVVGGLTAGIIMLVKITTGGLKMRFVPPAPGGSVFMETVPVFIAGFLLLKLAVGGVLTVLSRKGATPEGTLPFQLMSQWVLAILPLYPVLVRRMPWSEFRQKIGWHKGEGVFREIGAGLAGYFAGLPLLAAVMVITAGLFILRAIIHRMISGEEAPIPSNPIGELINKGSPVAIAMLFLLATLWAPLVEEAIFRGALYRHLRSRLSVMGAAIISALMFGLMHGYNILLLGPVITIGFIFALMREWRGSLIGSMTAHFLHNATTLALVLMALQALKD